MIQIVLLTHLNPDQNCFYLIMNPQPAASPSCQKQALHRGFRSRNRGSIDQRHCYYCDADRLTLHRWRLLPFERIWLPLQLPQKGLTLLL